MDIIAALIFTNDCAFGKRLVAYSVIAAIQPNAISGRL